MPLDNNANIENRNDIDVLRQLTGLEEWQGNLIHFALHRFLIPVLRNEKRFIPEEELLNQTLDLMQKQYDFSAHKRYREYGMTRWTGGETYLALREHEFDIAVTQEDLKRIADTIRQCYAYLYANSELVRFLRQGSWFSSEKSIAFDREGVSVKTKLDLVVGYFADYQPKMAVIDWKVGRSQTSNYSAQLRLYAIAALVQWPKYSMNNLTLMEINLLQGYVLEHPFDGERRVAMEDTIYRRHYGNAGDHW